jgi:hypothetical protein
MSTANANEQLMLDLINAERAAAGVSALVFNDKLNDSSEDHSSWMLNADQFSHTGENGSSAHERIKDAGYKFEGQYSSGENIAFQSERGAEGLTDDVQSLHDGLMNSPGHRANILNPDFKEIGIGIERGDFSEGGTDFDSVMVTQNFAASDADNSSTGTSTPTDPADTIADAGDIPAADGPATDTPTEVTAETDDDVVADDTPEVTADAGDDDTDDAPAPDDDVVADDAPDVTADAGDDDTDDAPVSDDDVVADDAPDVTADAGDDASTPKDEQTDEGAQEDDVVDADMETVDTDTVEGEFDGNLYLVSIDELNFNCGGDDKEAATASEVDAEAETGAADATGDTSDGNETMDDDFDMAMFVEQLADLLEDHFGDAFTCNEMAA